MALKTRLGNSLPCSNAIFWAFLLRSRRATGYAIASVLDAPCVLARMPSACLTRVRNVYVRAYPREGYPKQKGITSVIKIMHCFSMSYKFFEKISDEKLDMYFFFFTNLQRFHENKKTNLKL